MTNKLLKFVSFITALCVIMGVMPIVSFAEECELEYVEAVDIIQFSPETELEPTFDVSINKLYSNGTQVDTTKYFYNQLTANQKELYNQIQSAGVVQQIPIDLTNITITGKGTSSACTTNAQNAAMQDIMMALTALNEDNPLFFWASGFGISYGGTRKYSGGAYTYTITTLIININIDFYDKKYILINAKQLDKNSRFLSVTCYNHGELCSINASEHSAYIRYKKSDNNSVFNFCQIDRKGKILVELTEQMLISDGICSADLVIVNKGSAEVDAETGEIVAINNAAILSTMPIHIDVVGSPIDNSDVESSYEYNALNELLEKAETDYQEVVLMAKSYAIGGTGVRANENSDNAKYYSEQALQSANEAESNASKIIQSESNVVEYTNNALTYSQNAQTYMNNTKTYMDNAKVSETNASTSEQNAKASETNAKTSELNAKTSESNALTYKNTVEGINESIAGSINTLASNGNVGSFIFIDTITFINTKIV